jgi:uncharacterized protein
MTDRGRDADGALRYNEMVEGAFRRVVRDAIAHAAAHGLPGKHHFYITFLTDYPGVVIPPYLRERYPAEMTIVLQYQFTDLTVDDRAMAVTLSFNNAPERLVVPLKAISIFADPSVNFALQFQPPEGDPEAEHPGTAAVARPPGAAGGQDANAPPPTGQVVRLDQFRKKDE